MTESLTRAASTAAVPATEVPLHRNWRFQTLWIGSTTALTDHRGRCRLSAGDPGHDRIPAMAGLFGFLQAAATVTCGLPAGQFADRYDHRRIMVAAEGVRALAATGVALGWATHRLALVPLLVAAVLLGAAQPFVGTARTLLVRTVVTPSQLTAALTQDEVRGGLAELVGPSLGGLLYGLSRALPFLFSAASFTISLVCAVIVRPAEAPGAPVRRSAGPSGAGSSPGPWTGSRCSGPTPRCGPRWSWCPSSMPPERRSPWPRSTSCTACPRRPGASAWCSAVRRSADWPEPGWSSRCTGGSAPVGCCWDHRHRDPLAAALGLVRGPLPMAAVLFCTTLGIPALSVLLDVLIFRQVPDELRGRAIGSAMTVVGLGIPLGSGAGGLLLQWLGSTGALLVLAALLACGAGWAVAQPGLRAARWPSDRPGTA
ncbi:MFS transporter [Streptacidiphilus sp. 4-A2]|nr:MFS transporter [Streptacidiphilus sp. 4-A2]